MSLTLLDVFRKDTILDVDANDERGKSISSRPAYTFMTSDFVIYAIETLRSEF